MTPRRTLAAGCALALGLSLSVLGGAASASPRQGEVKPPGGFYTPPASLDGKGTGDVLKEEPTTVDVGTPVRAQRLMYVSNTPQGPKTAVTGTFLMPEAAWTGPGERPLVTYAVGTQGMADRCAPSRQLAAGTEYESPFLSTLLARGYAVVVTDYQGLGTPGVHAYTDSTALGRNVLDAARAAQRLATDAVPRDAPILISGYSEGGNAAAGALEQRAAYAPLLNVVGGYAGAVPADLPAVGASLDGSLYAAFLVYSVKALEAIYPQLHIERLLNAEGVAALKQANHSCTGDGLGPFAFKHSADYTKSGLPVTSFFDRPGIAKVLGRLALGNKAPDVPVLVAHSRLDDVVPFAQDQAMVRSWCAKGADVTFDEGVAPSHVAGAVEAFPKALAFFEQLVQGQHPEGNCATS